MAAIAERRKSLPHMPKGIGIPQFQVKGKNLATAFDQQQREGNQDQANQAMVPAAQSQVQNREARRENMVSSLNQAMVTKQRTSEPPPVFMAEPRRSLSLTRRKGSLVQSQLYRMDSGINPVDLLCGRLETWRVAIKSLVKLFKEILAIESKSATGYCKSSQVITQPFREGNGQFMESGGVQEVWTAFRNYAVEQSILHQDYVNYLERSVLPSLRSIKDDIKCMLKAITSDKQLRTSPIYDGRMYVDDLVAKLDCIIEADMRMPENAYQREDPLLLNCAIFQATKRLYETENNLQRNILNLQREVGLFEQNIVYNCRNICQRFQDFRLENKLESHLVIGQITSTFEGVQPDTEWNDFVQRNRNHLVSENAAYKTERDIHYRNQRHDLVKPIKVGLLERKSRMMRSWSEGLYILTPVGFLHGFRSAEAFEADPERPECSIFLPHTSVNYYAQEGCFEIQGRNIKSHLLGGREKNFEFRARDINDLHDWFNKIRPFSEWFQPEPFEFDNYQNRSLPPLPPQTEQERQQLLTSGEPSRPAAIMQQTTAAGASPMPNQGNQVSVAPQQQPVEQGHGRYSLTENQLEHPVEQTRDQQKPVEQEHGRYSLTENQLEHPVEQAGHQQQPVEQEEYYLAENRLEYPADQTRDQPQPAEQERGQYSLTENQLEHPVEQARDKTLDENSQKNQVANEDDNWDIAPEQQEERVRV